MSYITPIATTEIKLSDHGSYSVHELNKVAVWFK